MEPYSAASRAPLTLATMANNLLLVLDRFNCFSTSAVSTIWGMALGETKLPKSIVSKPTFNNELM